ncbi:MAG: hypothetical protein Q4E68_12990, partial [Prevotellaceae bacterium]|nr:hypothetical protein [Prevotellaceae bacterium]
MFSRDNRGDDLFSRSTIDTSNPDKIIIREKDEPRKKVRRRVKKGSKDAVLAKRQEIKKASKVKVVKEKRQEKKSIYDTTGFDFVDLDDEKKVSSGSTSKSSGYKLPRLSEIDRNDDFDNNDLGSDFRQSSADWKDASIPDYSGLDDLSKSSSGGFFDGFGEMSWPQWVAVALAVVLFISSILTTNVFAKVQCQDMKAEAFERLVSYEDTTFNQIAEAVESVETPISLEEATPQLGKVLSLVLSSVEKDLKIKLIDEDDTLVKNIPWSVTVTDNEGNGSEQADDDLDGIIHMTDISAGDYSVTLNANEALADFELPAEAQMVSVKAKVEYKVIANIKDEIKSEKEINAAAEDVHQAADKEVAAPATTDTVEFVDSTKTLNGEEYVEATPDLTKTASIKNENKWLSIVENIKANAKAKFGNRTVSYITILPDEEDPSSSSETENPSGETTSSSSETTSS